MYFQSLKDFRRADTEEQIEYLRETLDDMADDLIKTCGQELMYEGHAINAHMEISEEKMLDRVYKGRGAVSTFCDTETALIVIEQLVNDHIPEIADWLALSKEEMENKYKDTGGKIPILGYAGGYIGKEIDENLNEKNTSLVTVMLNANPFSSTYFNIRTAYPDIPKDKWWGKEFYKNNFVRKPPVYTGKNYRKEVLERIKNEKDELLRLYWGIKIDGPKVNINYNEKNEAIYCTFSNGENEFMIRLNTVKSGHPTLAIRDKSKEMNANDNKKKYTVIKDNDINITDSVREIVDKIEYIKENIQKTEFIDMLIEKENIIKQNQTIEMENNDFSLDK